MAEHKPKVLLLGEAPGYRGMRMTGRPFMSRSMLQSENNHFGLFHLEKGYDQISEYPDVKYESTSAAMWETLEELNFLPVLWSAYPFHPHQIGEQLSNRTPTTNEIASGQIFWQTLIQLFNIKSMVAVGNIGYKSLVASVLSRYKIRYPAHGGKFKFKEGLMVLLNEGINS